MLTKTKGYWRLRIRLPWGDFWFEWQNKNRDPGIISPATPKESGGWK